MHGPAAFDDLIAEQTPGGLNEGAIKMLGEKGVWRGYSDVLDATLVRLTR